MVHSRCYGRSTIGRCLVDEVEKSSKSSRKFGGRCEILAVVLRKAPHSRRVQGPSQKVAGENKSFRLIDRKHVQLDRETNYDLFS
jgi:hypothetical protein